MSEPIERRRPLVVAIDGPAASGKSSTAKWVANELGFKHVDSGALYRAATLAALRREPDHARWTEDLVLGAAQAVTLEPGETSFHPRLDGGVIDEALRRADVTSCVSQVAAMARVREWVNGIVRAAAEGWAVVVDGRDMGADVFPYARVKVFLVADPRERAKRRSLQLLERLPSDEEIALETAALVHRDANDVVQTRQAPDAVVIDTTFLTQEEQVERIVALARRAMRS